MPRPDPENVERVAVLGAGTIGASWTALFLAQGRAVAGLRPGVGHRAAGARLHRAGLADARAARPRAERRSDPLHAPQGRRRGGRGRRARPGERAGGSRGEAGAVRGAGGSARAGRRGRLEHLRPDAERAAGRAQGPRALRRRPPLQPAPPDPAGRGGRRARRPTRRWSTGPRPSTPRSASGRSPSAARCRATSPTGCRRRSIARRSTWCSRGSPASRTSTPRSPTGRGCAGR